MPSRRVVLIVVLTVVVIPVTTVGYALLARFGLNGPVRPHSLSVSVARAVDSAGPTLDDQLDPCQRGRDPRVWTCTVLGQEGSGGATYVVTVRPGGSCWRARRLRDGSEGGMPARASGCVHRWQWSVVSLL